MARSAARGSCGGAASGRSNCEVTAPEDAPDLEGGTAWFNCAAPIKMKDLKGKIVLLDFWTLC